MQVRLAEETECPSDLHKPARMMEGGGESKRMQGDLMEKIKKSAESDRRGGDV